MTEKRIGLVLPPGRIWIMSLPFRLAYRARVLGFSPGLRNLLGYEVRRLWYLLYERDRLTYLAYWFYSPGRSRQGHR